MEDLIRNIGSTLRFAIALILVVLLLFSIVVAVAVWPNLDLGPATRFSAELRMLLLVAAGGALGSSLRGLTDFMRLAEGKRPAVGWQWRVLLQAFMGVPLALSLYMVLRGGVLSTAAGATDLNPYGIVALSTFCGLGAGQLLERLFTRLGGNDEEVTKQLDEIGSALGILSLVNYQGFVCLKLGDASGDAPETGADGSPVLLVGRTYSLYVWFQREKPSRFFSDELWITGGDSSAEVEFSLASDSDGARVQRRTESVKFAVAERSTEAKFLVEVMDTAGKHELWVEISQKRRTVQMVSINYEVKATKG